MKILYFHQHFNSPNGTVGIRSYQMALALIAKGHKVVMVCGSYDGGATGLTDPFENGRRRGVVQGIEIVEFDLAYSNSDRFLKRIMTFIRYAIGGLKFALKEEYDLLFATSTPLTAAIPGIFARWLRHKPFVFEVRDLWPELPRAMGVIRNPFLLWALSALEWAGYRSAHRLIGLSSGIVDGIASRGVPRERIALIPNGCDLSLFSLQEQAWRPQCSCRDDLLAIYAGTHGIANGLEALLDASAELISRGRADIKLLLVGSGRLKAELQLRAKQQNLTNVIFHDPISKVALAGLLAGADLGLQLLSNVPAFYYGTSPNKFFDYLSAGKPVLNNYPGWVAELITAHHCGFVVPPNDPKAFADALEQAADNRKALKEMGVSARALGEAKFDREVLAEKWVSWIETAAI